MIDGLLWLYETTFDLKWLDAAAELNETVIEHYDDEERGGFFYTADDHETLIVRTKDAGDGAVPSGNSVQTMNLLRLAILLNRPELRDKADANFKLFARQANERPGSMERLLAAADFRLHAPREIALVGKPDDARMREMFKTIYGTYVPNKVVALLDPSADADATGKRIPLLANKSMINGAPTAYVCQNYTCQAPTTDPAKLADQLK
jgi:uncharacterized protein YyaL (SSP411 family)